MPTRRISFAPGPAMLPDQVVTAFRDAVTTYGRTGLGILELGHRSDQFANLVDDTKGRLRNLVGIPYEYEVLLLHGGARLQFAMLPANLLPANRTADYLDSGHFAHNAAEEARIYGGVHIGSTTAAVGYRQLPAYDATAQSPSPVYVHYTSNNTEVGTQFVRPPHPPDGAWLACDASSDLLTRAFNVGSHGIMYATAHKNLGTAGLAVVILKRSLLEPVRPLPAYFMYDTHARAGSRFNTPPVASILTLNLMLRWVSDAGGVREMERRSQAKAAAVYNAIDTSDFYRGLAKPGDRSLVNVTFAAPTAELEEGFLAEAADAGLDGLWGYRKVGHLRASLFNAVSEEHCDRLSQFMTDFADRHRQASPAGRAGGIEART